MVDLGFWDDSRRSVLPDKNRKIVSLGDDFWKMFVFSACLVRQCLFRISHFLYVKVCLGTESGADCCQVQTCWRSSALKVVRLLKGAHCWAVRHSLNDGIMCATDVLVV